MAKEEAKTEEEEGGKKGGKMMIIIIVAVVVLLGGGGAGAYFFLFAGGDEETEVAESEAVEESAPQVSGEAFYVPMPGRLQFNAPGISRERLVQIEVQLMVRGAENEEKALRHVPMLKGNLLQVFSSTTAEEIVTEQGKRELREKATAQIRQVMQDLENDPVVEEVLFTGLVIQ